MSSAIGPTLIVVVGLACAALIGFAAHRASLCNVRAVAELMTQGSAHMLGSLMQAALWMAWLGTSLAQLSGAAPLPVRMADPVVWAMLGGALFGMGAALNGGCSLSTLHRLADGEAGMLITLLGFVLGVLAWAEAAPLAHAAPLLPLQPAWQRWPALAPALLAALSLWAVSRLVVMVRLARYSRARSWRERVLASAYPLAVSAAVLGLAGGVLAATQGAWSYTNHLRQSALQAWAGAAMPAAVHTALVAALLAGMAGSALQRGSFAWRCPRPAAAVRHGSGGVLMGTGAALVPGGNDTLLLNALPTLAGQAVAAYLSLLAGIAFMLWLLDRRRGLSAWLPPRGPSPRRRMSGPR